MLKDETPVEVMYADNNNSYTCPHYYLDSNVDIPTSRARSKNLATSGYYELTVPIPKVDPKQMARIREVDEYISSTVQSVGDLRRAVWETQSGAYSLSVRIFESIVGKKGSSSSSSSKKGTQGVEILYVQKSDDGTTKSVNLTVQDQLYLTFVGPARLVFTPSVLTCVKGYKKIVYRCTALVLTPTKSKVKGGIVVEMQQPSGNTKEFDDLISIIRSMINSGTSAKEIARLLKAPTSEKHTEVASHKRRTEQRPAREEEEQQVSGSSDSDDDRDRAAYDEDDDDEDVDKRREEEQEEKLQRKGKSKAMPKQAPNRIMDPPNTHASSIQKTRPKYAPRQ